MADRRMFTKKITESDAFLEMPASSQMLYFHFCMNADDDGFVNNQKKIQRMCNATDDDFKLLVAKSFVILFETGIIVIKHWRMHNYIQSDRYTPSGYIEEKSMIGLKSNGAYTLNEEKMVTKELTTPKRKAKSMKPNNFSKGMLTCDVDVENIEKDYLAN